jgi:hypothetical protein
MRKLRVPLVLIVVAVLMLMPVQPARPTQAMGFYEEYHTVWYNCICSPGCYGTVVGEWTRDCNGNMTGWGWEPGHECTATDVTYGTTECVP